MKITWNKLSEKKPEDCDMEQVILKLGDSYIFQTGAQINTNIIGEANWSEEKIQEQIKVSKVMGFFGQASGFDSGKIDQEKSEKNIRDAIEKKKLAIEKAEWCSFSEFVKASLSKQESK